MTNWYLFAVAPNKDVQTARRLREQGFDVVVMMRQQIKRRHRKHNVATIQHRIPTPAMSPYIFVDMAGPSAWHKLRSAPVKLRPVSIDGGPPRPLSPAGVQFILDPPRPMFHDTQVPRFQSAPNVQPGDKVRVYTSGFDGLEAKVLKVGGKDAKVMMHLFASEHEVDVPVSALVSAA